MEQDEAYEHLIGPENCLLTGSAGHGKSFLVNKILKDLGNAAGKSLAVCASTGIAARNIMGTTVHSFLGIGLGRNYDQDTGRIQDFEKFWQKCVYSPWFNKAAISHCEFLIIDEVSMITGTFLNDINEIFKRVKQSVEPFGGTKVILCGDFLQLPPVTKSPRFDWVFKSKSWKEANIKCLHLTRQYRQNDPTWIKCLGEVRQAKISQESHELIRSREVKKRPENFEGTFLMTHNEQVREYNAKKLGELSTPLKEFPAICYGKENKIVRLFENLTTPRVLQIKEGAKVMATVNDRDGMYFNGSIGIVKKIKPEEIEVVFEDHPYSTVVNRFKFTDEHRNVDPSKEKTSATVIRQFPLRLAYAITIHSAQGQTLSKVFIEASHVFAPHMTYVALSRCKTLEGLSILGYERSKIYVDVDARTFYEKIALQEEKEKNNIIQVQ